MLKGNDFFDEFPEMNSFGFGFGFPKSNINSTGFGFGFNAFTFERAEQIFNDFFKNEGFPFQEDDDDFFSMPMPSLFSHKLNQNITNSMIPKKKK